jgi:hypothetical protein
LFQRGWSWLAEAKLIVSAFGVGLPMLDGEELSSSCIAVTDPTPLHMCMRQPNLWHFGKE